MIKKIFFALLLACLATAYAETSISDTTSYTEMLVKIERDLKKKNFNEKNLAELIKQVSPIKAEATQCANDGELALQKFKQDLASLGESVKGEVKEVRQKRTELKNEISRTEKSLASCKVLILRSDEVLKSLTDHQQNLLAERLLAVGPEIRSLVKENWDKPALWWQSISAFVINNSGLEHLSPGKIALLLFFSAICFFIGRVIRRHIKKRVRVLTEKDSFSDHFTCNLFVVLAKYLPRVLVSLVAVLFFYLLTSDIKPVPFVSVVVYGIPLYFLIGMVIELFLNAGKGSELFDGLPGDVARSLSRRLKVLLLLLFIGYLMFTTILSLSLPEAVYLLAREIFATVFVLNLIWAVWVLGRVPSFEDMIAVRLILSLALLSLLGIELYGYRNLANYIVLGSVGTLFSVGFFLLVSKLSTELFEGLEHGKKSWQKHFRESLGVKKRKQLPELIWSRLIIIAGLWIGLVILLLHIWGLSDTSFAQLRRITLEGFTVGSLTIIPVRVLLAIIVLTIMLAISGWIRARLEKSWLTKTGIDRGAREATATISGYIGVALAILASLSVAGVEFGNLAIIAGALSVGIGFGLQNIVNNFVSGLILLFERPIKTGDWIVVGSTEGFVKRISIRSTQIQTFDQADVIVPNSELISGQVTNWMLRDVSGRIRVPVGVAYGSDTEKVKQILHDIAMENAEVVRDGSLPEPQVLFLGFGESSLDFELRVFIDRIDKKPRIISDLNFQIDKAFRENNVEIPFPQRDLHVRSGMLNIKQVNKDE